MKILTTQDNHINPKWISESEEDIARICDIAKGEKVDAICIAGDFFDKEIRSSDNDKYDRILQLARDLQAVAQVYFIYGTPSHDSPGAYSALKDIGWIEVGIGKSHVVGDTLIMGLPEINTGFIHANFPELNKQEGIEKQYDLVNQIINDYYVPLAKSHKGPVHFMGHGHVDGVKFRDDQNPRTSEFMFNESMLARIGADYYQFGHIHLPQDFKTITGGYGGTTHLTWNDVNFKAGFKIVDYREDINGIIGCIVTPYKLDKPMRQKINISDIDKINESMNKIINGCNVWIDIKCDKAFHDQFDHAGTLSELIEKYNLAPLSKITTTIQHEEHIRVDLEEYEKATTLEDLALIYNPDFSKSIIKKINIAEQATDSETRSITPRTIEFLDMELIGSIINYENGVARIFVDYEHFKLGANLFIGSNGKGKSVLIGLTNGFSVHLPSGNKLVKLFVSKNSSMVRRFRIVETGEIITQKLLFDPTLADPSSKFYMDINGKNIAAENGNVKPFDEKVSEIFGSIKMFMATVLKAQKENIKMPSLENAKESDLRQVFTELSGIDRTPIKNFANSEVKKLKSSIALDSREVEVLQSVDGSVKDISIAIADNEHKITDKETALSNNKSVLEYKKTELSEQDKIVNENSTIDSQISDISAEAQNLTADNGRLKYELRNISVDLENIDDTRSELEKLRTIQNSQNEASTAYFEAQETFNNSVDIWQKIKEIEEEKLKKITEDAEEFKTGIETMKSNVISQKSKLENLNNSNSFLNKPCEHCNKLSSTSEKEISVNNIKIKQLEGFVEADSKTEIDFNNRLQSLRTDYKTIKDSIPEKPEQPENITTLKNKMDSFKPDPAKISELETIINGLKSSEMKKTELETVINQKKNRISEISKQIEELKSKIKPVDIKEYYYLKSVAIPGIEAKINLDSGEIGRLTAEIEALHKRLQDNIKREDKIKALIDSLAKQQTDLTEWEIVEQTFNAKGIPAFELSLIAPAINQKANEFLSMHSNRFNVDIVTQDLDSKNNIAEKFKILVHDSKAAAVKNLPNCSPGQLSWLTSALQEAVSYIRSKRSGRTYLWSIIDERDGAIDTETMSDFYKLLARAMDGKRKLISVTHSPIVKGMGLNTVDIDDFFMGGGNEV